jgi:hypothetical protein
MLVHTLQERAALGLFGFDLVEPPALVLANLVDSEAHHYRTDEEKEPYRDELPMLG